MSETESINCRAPNGTDADSTNTPFEINRLDSPSLTGGQPARPVDQRNVNDPVSDDEAWWWRQAHKWGC
jgi:hypothetical protein